jgi:hypothetical protein
MVLLGVLAIRMQSLNKTLKWDAENMKFLNIADSEELRIVTSDEFKVIDGHPHSNTKYARLNAIEAASEYVKHTYHNGWTLPDMPI